MDFKFKSPEKTKKRFSGAGQSMSGLISQQRGQASQQATPPGAVVTQVRNPYTGANYVDPVASGKVRAEEFMQEKVAETASPRAIMRGTLVKAKRLTDMVPAPPAGLNKIPKGINNVIKGATGEIPQINEFHNMIDSSLSAFGRTMFLEKGTQSNKDISRIKKSFADIAWDTEDQRALGWNRAIDTYNGVISSYKTLSGETIDKRELLSPKEIGRARFLSGENKFDDLTDEEISGATEGDLKMVPKPIKEKLYQEAKRRGLI